MTNNFKNIDVHSFAQAQLDTYNLSGFRYNLEKAFKSMTDDILEEFNELNSIEVLQERFKYFAIDGTRPTDYQERVLCLDGDKKVIYGIRHMGGNVDIPFIQLTTNFRLTKNYALSIYEKIKEEFTKFKPLYICFHSASKLNDIDMIAATHMVSTSKDIGELDNWPYEDQISFKTISDDSYYKWYKEGYALFNRESPELAKKVTVNSHDSMKESMEQGLLKLVFLNGEKIGLICAERSNFLGHEGIYFHEIYIDKKWKGKGLAKAIQRKFVNFNTNDNDFVWGTIDYANLNSYRTALSNRRKPVRYENFVCIN